VVDTDGQVTTHDGRLTLHTLRHFVGGYVEVCPRVRRVNGATIPISCTVYADEEGVPKGLPVNKSVPHLRGTLVIVKMKGGRYHKFKLALESLAATHTTKLPPLPPADSAPFRAPLSLMERIAVLDECIQNCVDVDRRLTRITAPDCEHEYWDDGECDACGYKCPHEKVSANNACHECMWDVCDHRTAGNGGVCADCR
jgi:hypothetical protein